jgi:hypothetical protein
MYKRSVIGTALQERLGVDASRELEDYVEQSGQHWRGVVLDSCTSRVEGRMNHYADRSEVVDGFGRIVTQMAEMKVDILRWSFAFWVGQVVVTLALVALFARLLKA